MGDGILEIEPSTARDAGRDCIEPSTTPHHHFTTLLPPPRCLPSHTTTQTLTGSRPFLPPACRYHEMLDVMEELGIEPNATLHHFTHPLWFEDAGAFGKEENIAAFVEYAKVCLGGTINWGYYWQLRPLGCLP